MCLKSFSAAILLSLIFCFTATTYGSITEEGQGKDKAVIMENMH